MGRAEAKCDFEFVFLIGREFIIGSTYSMCVCVCVYELLPFCQLIFILLLNSVITLAEPLFKSLPQKLPDFTYSLSIYQKSCNF